MNDLELNRLAQRFYEASGITLKSMTDKPLIVAGLRAVFEHLKADGLRLWRLVEALDQRIDDGAGPAYHEQPLAQDWARVAKVQEEAGEAIDALIGVTAQNHRKGQYGSMDDLFDELADVALTGVYAIQHFTKDIDRTRAIFLARAERHAERVGIDVDMS